jgi:hypothetical protein
MLGGLIEMDRERIPAAGAIPAPVTAWRCRNGGVSGDYLLVHRALSGAAAGTGLRGQECGGWEVRRLSQAPGPCCEASFGLCSVPLARALRRPRGHTRASIESSGARAACNSRITALGDAGLPTQVASQRESMETSRAPIASFDYIAFRWMAFAL